MKVFLQNLCIRFPLHYKKKEEYLKTEEKRKIKIKKQYEENLNNTISKILKKSYLTLKVYD